MPKDLDTLLKKKAELEKEIEQAKKEASVGEFTEETDALINSTFVSKEWLGLIRTVESCVKETAKRGYADEDNDVYIAEAAMQAVYGKNMFDWYNELIN
jgi:SLT domain-containing protein